MAFVSVPKDLSRIKNKAIMNLTIRQVVCFGSAAAVGIPTFILTHKAIGNTTAALLMIALMLPLFFFAMYEKDGQPAEKILRNFIRARIYYPGKRLYKTENLYELLEMEGKSVANQNAARAQTASVKSCKRQ